MISFFMILISAFAQNSFGRVQEREILEFRSYQAQLTAWLQKSYDDGSLAENLNLPQFKIDVDGFWNRYQIAVTRLNKNIRFKEEPIWIGDQVKRSRVCRNLDGQVECNRNDWKFAQSVGLDAFLLALVFHEILGIAEIEVDRDGNSNFDLSSRLYLFAAEILILPLSKNSIIDFRTTEYVDVRYERTFEKIRLNQGISIFSSLSGVCKVLAGIKARGEITSVTNGQLDLKEGWRSTVIDEEGDVVGAGECSHGSCIDKIKCTPLSTQEDK